MKVIFGSANHWTSPYQVGSHAWARLFARNGFDVAYVSDPVTPWHWLEQKNWSRTWERFALWQGGGVLEEDGRLRAWTPLSFISPRNSPFFRSNWALHRWSSFGFPSAETKLRQWGFESPDILWLDSVRHAGWGRALGPKITVLRVADWNAGFEAVPGSALDLEREMIGECDLVIASARSLEEQIKPLRNGRPLTTIRNGVDVSFWNRPSSLPEEYARIPAPRVVYVGAMDQWFDVNLLFELARALPKISFVLIGQRRFSLPGANLPSNVYWLGSRPRDQVRGYLQHAQVGMIPFRRNELVECVCPLKLYEYMACGLPVVATRWRELKYMNSPALLAGDADEWVAHLQTLIAPSGQRSGLSNGRKGELLDYASQNDWKQRWQQWQVTYKTLYFTSQNL